MQNTDGTQGEGGTTCGMSVSSCNSMDLSGFNPCSQGKESHPPFFTSQFPVAKSAKEQSLLINRGNPLGHKENEHKSTIGHKEEEEEELLGFPLLHSKLKDDIFWWHLRRKRRS